MKENELFSRTSDTQLKYLYQQILAGREQGLRPRALDEYIREVEKTYQVSFGEAWKITEKLFWDEVGRRYFCVKRYFDIHDQRINVALTIEDDSFISRALVEAFKEYFKSKDVRELTLSQYRRLSE